MSNKNSSSDNLSLCKIYFSIDNNITKFLFKESDYIQIRNKYEEKFMGQTLLQ